MKYNLKVCDVIKYNIDADIHIVVSAAMGVAGVHEREWENNRFLCNGRWN